LRPDQVCVIGDEIADIRLAKGAGTWSVAKEGTLNRDQIKATEADAVVGEMQELLSLLALEPREKTGKESI
jgi:phosphoglycolate phosphatase-like HAD superfamily hydrolase